MKRGRPRKYTTAKDKITARREQWKTSKRRMRTNLKLQNEIESKITIYDKENEYRETLAEYISGFEFNAFLVLSVDPQKIDRTSIKKYYSNTITNFQQKHEKNAIGLSSSFVSHKSIVKHARKFTQYMSDNKLFNRAFLTLEKSNEDNYHINLIVNMNSEKENALEVIARAWVLGRVECRHLETINDKKNVINYSVKELRPFSAKKTDINKMDAWFPFGNYLTKN